MEVGARASSPLRHLLEEECVKHRKYAIFYDKSCYIIANGGNALTRLPASAGYATPISLFR
jgi:hypothetical protein